MSAVTSSVSILACAVTLAGCGGGGGGFNVQPPSGLPTYSSPIKVDVIDPLDGKSPWRANTEFYARDLNKDGVDEVIMGGRLTGAAIQHIGNDWYDFNMQLYGWNTGKFSNETYTWFAQGENKTKGTSGVKFADFNGDGHVDMFAQPDTDTDKSRGGVIARPWVFYNNGDNSFTRSQVNNLDQWAHSSHVGDYNNDGYADILIPSYGTPMTLNYGGPNGFTTYTTNGIDVPGEPGYGSGAGVSVGNYMNDGSLTVVMTDASSDQQNDTKLFRLYAHNNPGDYLMVQEIANLPGSRFYLDKWRTQLANSPTNPHAIRNFAFDFNNDGLDDVIVMDSLGSPDSYYHAYSEMQFLVNRGNGKFEDVTDTVLVGYDNRKSPSYTPQFIDFNNDGLVDIFLDAQTFAGDGQPIAARVLLQTSDGKFVEKHSEMFAGFKNEVNFTGSHSAIQIVQGPNGHSYMLAPVDVNVDGDVKVETYLAKIGSAGTITPQNVFDTIQAAWPYLTDEQVTSLMRATSTEQINGIPTINLDMALQPSTVLKVHTGYLPGTTLQIPGLSDQMFQKVASFDGTGRHFYVDLSSTTSNSTLNFETVSKQPTQSFSSGLSIDGINAYSTGNTYAFGADSSLLDTASPWKMGITISKTETHPWINFTGAFGSIESAENLELDVNRHFDNGMWTKLGLIQTSTEFTPGMVTNVSNILSAYYAMGYSVKNLNVYTGVQPTIVSGTVSFNLPTGVDDHGKTLYTSTQQQVRNNIENFVGVEYTHNVGPADLKVDSYANTAGDFEFTVGVEVPW